MARRLRIGLTGGIASGKSTVAQRFRELGVAVIDADEVARNVVEPGEPALAQIAVAFGPRALRADGHLDRAALREVIFQDPAARRELEAILHPLIRARMERLADAADGPYVVLAIPLLIEGLATPGGKERVDRILVVDVEEDEQLRRLQERDHCTDGQARAIVAAQASRAKRLAAADEVLRNVGSVTELRQSVDRLHAAYLAMAKAEVYPGPGIGSE